MKAADSSLTWKEIAVKIDWRYKSSKSGVALLNNARKRLMELEKEDPEKILAEVEYFRANKTKEMK